MKGLFLRAYIAVNLADLDLSVTGMAGPGGGTDLHILVAVLTRASMQYGSEEIPIGGPMAKLLGRTIIEAQHAILDLVAGDAAPTAQLDPEIERQIKEILDASKNV